MTNPIFAYGPQRIPYLVLWRDETTVTLSTPKGLVTKPLGDVLGTIELTKDTRVELTTTPGREYRYLDRFTAPAEFKNGAQEFEYWVYLQSPTGELAVWKLSQIRPVVPN